MYSILSESLLELVVVECSSSKLINQSFAYGWCCRIRWANYNQLLVTSYNLWLIFIAVQFQFLHRGSGVQTNDILVGDSTIRLWLYPLQKF